MTKRRINNQVELHAFYAIWHKRSAAQLLPKACTITFNPGILLSFIQFTLLLLGFSFCLNSAYGLSASNEEFAIFTQNANVAPISKSKAKMIFIGKAKSLKPLGKFTLMDWPLSSPERRAFYDKLLKKTPAQVNSKWASLAFSGQAKPPTEIHNPSQQAIHEWLQNNPKGIAYAPVSQVPKGANILLKVQ